MPLRTQEDSLFQLQADGAGMLRDGAGMLRDSAGMLRDNAGMLRTGMFMLPCPLEAGLVRGKRNGHNGVAGDRAFP